MPSVSSSVVVTAPAAAVFDFIEDFRNIPRLQPHLSSVYLETEQARGVGAEVSLEGRFHGVPMHAHNTIIACVPPRRLVSISKGTVLSRSTWQLDEVHGPEPSTRVTLTIDYKLTGGVLGGLGGPFAAYFQHEIKGMTEDSLKRLRSFVEEGKEP